MIGLEQTVIPTYGKNEFGIKSECINFIIYASFGAATFFQRQRHQTRCFYIFCYIGNKLVVLDCLFFSR